MQPKNSMSPLYIANTGLLPLVRDTGRAATNRTTEEGTPVRQDPSPIIARERQVDPYAMAPDKIFLTFGMPLLLIGCFILLVYLKRRGPAKNRGSSALREKSERSAAPYPIDAKVKAATASDSLLKDGRKGRIMTIEGSRRKLG